MVEGVRSEKLLFDIYTVGAPLILGSWVEYWEVGHQTLHTQVALVDGYAARSAATNHIADDRRVMLRGV